MERKCPFRMVRITTTQRQGTSAMGKGETLETRTESEFWAPCDDGCLALQRWPKHDGSGEAFACLKIGRAQ